MNPQPLYLEKIHSDLETNLSGFQTCLAAAYAAARKKTDPISDADFDSPNQASLEGFIRWGFIDTYLARGCSTGLLKGLTAHWMPTCKGQGGIQALELRGRYTALAAHHLQFPQDAPRESEIRTDMRVLNEMNPMLPNFDASIQEEIEADPDLFNWKSARDKRLINVTLVHGSKKEEFAYFRVYDRKDDLSSYISTFGNIMALPVILKPLESEHVKDPEIGLKTPTKDKRAGSAEGGK